MAKITVRELTLEIVFDSVQYGWINYAVYFKWKDVNVFNRRVLWGGPRHINKPDALWANDDDDERTIVNVIEEVLQKKEPIAWQTLEPDIIIAFYPGRLFPFIKTHSELPVDHSHEMLSELVKEGKFVEAEDYLKYQYHAISEDYIQIIAKVDTHNFTPNKERGYGSEGISLHMVVKEWELYNFLKELKQEYHEFVLKHQAELSGEEE